MTQITDTEFLQFTESLDNRIRRTEPDAAGTRTRYLVDDAKDLWDFAVQLCYSYLTSESARLEIPKWLQDENLLWFFQEFIHRQSESLSKTRDTEAIVLGLTAVVLIGIYSDPRDLVLWTGEIYSAARESGIQHGDIEAIYMRIGQLASEEILGTPRVAAQIFRCPRLEGEAWDQRMERRRQAYLNP